jgi:hypothetical protein
VALVAALALSCARAGGPPADPRQAAPAVDSVTVALWRFDEQAGVRCADSGPFRIEATAGPDTRIRFGRFAGAREFARSFDSFVYAAHNPMLDPPGGLTVEAWVMARAFGLYRDTPIAVRWGLEETQQSWLFGVVGGSRTLESGEVPGLGYENALVASARPGQLVFAFRPGDASEPRAFVSAQAVPLERWTHVAVSYDGRVVRFFLDGRLDAQYATSGRIRPSTAPLIIGNHFDPRQLSGIRGDLRVTAPGYVEPVYAFAGLIDELRISSTGRSAFPGTGAR